MKLIVLSIVLLVSISGTVLGYANYTTNDDENGTINVTGKSTDTNTVNTTATDTDVQETVVSTPEEVAGIAESTPETAESTYQRETTVPEKPVQTPKSPGFGSVVSVVALLLAIYIGRKN